MLESQRVQLKMSTTREAHNDLASAESAEDISRRDTLKAELKALEGEYRAAIESESTPTGDTPEAREWSALNERFDIGEMFGNVIEHRVSAGPIAEVQQERDLAANAIPTELLMEKRAVTPAPADVGQTQSQIEGYVFPRSVADFLGVPSPIVGVGDQTYPVLTSNPSAGTPAENDPQTETTGAFTADVLTQSRIQASFFWSREDAGRMAGMGDALRDALAGGLADKLDSEIMRGTNGLLTGTNLDNNNVNTETTFALYVSQFGYSRVDGRFAGEVTDIRSVMGTGTYAHAGAEYRHANADDVALDRLTQITGGVRVSAHVPPVASDKQNAVVRLGMRRDMVAPLWGGITLIPDEVTKAANGQIQLTAVLMHAVKILRKGGFRKQQTQHA